MWGQTLSTLLTKYMTDLEAVLVDHEVRLHLAQPTQLRWQVVDQLVVVEQEGGRELVEVAELRGDGAADGVAVDGERVRKDAVDVAELFGWCEWGARGVRGWYEGECGNGLAAVRGVGSAMMLG